MAVVELFDERTDLFALFGRDGDLVPVQDLMEHAAGVHELDAVLLPAFAVLALLRLFVVGGLDLFGKVRGVDAREVMLGNFLFGGVVARGGDLLREHEVRVVHGGQQPEALRVLIRKRGKVYRVVANDAVRDAPLLFVGDEHLHHVDARVLDLLRLLFADLLLFADEHLARGGVDDILRGDAAGQAVGDVEFFVEFVAPHLHHVVAARVEEEVMQVLAHGVVRRHFAGAEPPVQLDEAVLLAAGGVLFDGRIDHAFVFAEDVADGGVGAEAEGAQKHRGADLALTVDVHPHHALRILFEFQPGAAVGDDGRFEHLPARLVLFRIVVRARGTDELRDDDALRAVDDEGTVFGHEREIAHEHFLVDDFFLDLVDEAHFHAQRQRIRCVAVAALLLVVFGRGAERMVEKIQLEVIGVIGNGRKVLKDFADALFDERSVRFLLDLDKVGDLDDLVDLAEFPSLCLAVLLGR